MKERLITLACALAALALFYVLFVPKPPTRDSQLSRPTSVESREHGYLAARRWLEGSGNRVISLRERYDTAFGPPKTSPSREGHGQRKLQIPATGNLLIVTAPNRFAIRLREEAALREWLLAGNTLLVMAALGDTPEWAQTQARSFFDDLGALTGVDFKVIEPPPGTATNSFANTAFAKAERIELRPNGKHPLFMGVERLAAKSELPADDWHAHVPATGFVFALAHEYGGSAEAFWMRPLGQGRILISGYASLFDNAQLGEQDNARLLANIVASSLAPRGAVIFDDMHQGLSSLYNPDAFFSDRRLYYTLAISIGLWLIWVLGGTQLKPSPPPRPAPGESSLVRASGGFFARVLEPAAAGRRLLELFANDLQRLRGEPQTGELPWDWLARRPHMHAADLAALRDSYDRLSAGRRVDLGKLHLLILRIQDQTL